MIGKGVFKVELEDKTVGFQFGTLGGAYTEQKTGVSMFELFNAIKEGKTTTSLLLHYFWGAAKAYADINGLEDVTVAEVSTWLDDMGIGKVFEIYGQSVQSPKNGKAPKPEAELKQL